jgi:predicted amidohydrolase YtcJ
MLLAFFTAPGAAEAQSMLLKNAVIWTGDPARPWGEAMLVENSTVRAVGAEASVAGLAGPDTPVIDLQGAFVTPGLVDAHCHVLGLGQSLERVNLVGANSLQETLDRVADAVGHRDPADQTGWVLGRGWDQNDWPGERFPDRHDLDRVSRDVPISLSRVDGHALWVNSRALELAGVTADTPDPEGGKIHRDAEGNPTGVLLDNAEDLVTRVVPKSTREAKARAIERATQTLARDGLTTVHDMGMSPEELAIYRELAETNRLAVRIYAALSAGTDLAAELGTDPNLAAALDRGPDRGWDHGRFKLGMVKFYADGALGSRGAALLASYSDDPGNRGLLVTEPEALRAGMLLALQHGFQCAVHAIGDRGNRTVLDAWASIRKSDPAAAKAPGAETGPLTLVGAFPAVRPAVRLEHAQIIHPDDLPRVGALGVVASMQPTHCTSDMPWAPERLGPERLHGAYAWRTLTDEGAVFVLGSDFPVESHDPLRGIYAAVTRQDTEGRPGGGWIPRERLAREEALTASTAGPAYVSGDLAMLGTLTPGKRADFSVFDRNLVTCDARDLLAAKALWTVVDGRTAWKAPAFAAPEEDR